MPSPYNKLLTWVSLAFSLSLLGCVVPPESPLAPQPTMSPLLATPTPEISPTPLPTASPFPIPTEAPLSSADIAPAPPSPEPLPSESSTPQSTLLLNLTEQQVLAVGQTLKLSARLQEATGKETSLEGVALEWTAAPEENLSVDERGNVKALRGPASGLVTVHMPGLDLSATLAIEIRLSDPSDALEPEGFKFRELKEFTVSENTLPQAYSSNSIAMNLDGDFVVAWYDDSDPDGKIRARCFDGRGEETKSEFKVNTYTVARDHAPVSTDVAIDDNGNFLVVWSGGSEEDLDEGTEIMARRYNSDCRPESGPFQVNTLITGDQIRPSVAMDKTGNFIIVWESADPDSNTTSIQGRRYTQAGTLPGNEFMVNAIRTEQSHHWADVVLDAAGDFRVAWTGTQLESNEQSVRMRHFDAKEEGGSEEILARVDGDVFSIQGTQIAMDAEGDYSVIWQDDATDNGRDADYWGVHGQRYQANGILDSSFQVNSFTLSAQQEPAVAIDDSGNFIVAWSSFGQEDSGYGVYAQRYNPMGLPEGSEFRLSKTTAKSQTNPVVTMNGVGHFVASWIDGEFQDSGKRIMAGNGS